MGRGERCVQRVERGKGGSSPSINLQAGAGVRRPGNAGGRAGAGYGVIGRRQSSECPPAQPDAWLFRNQLREDLGWGCRVSWVNWPEREGGDGSLESATENRRSRLLPLIFFTSGRPCPYYQPPHPVKMQVHKQGASSFFQVDRTGEAT